MAIEKQVIINNKYGLHARPAMAFVKLAKNYGSKITVSKGDTIADGKSIMEIMTLGAEKGSTVMLKVEGTDEADAFEALVDLLSEKFGES